MQQPIALILVGLPCYGKTTWATTVAPTLLGEFALISIDKYVELEAQVKRVSYGTMFPIYVKTAEKLMKAELDISLAEGRNIVWDQTNVTEQSRAGKIAQLQAAGYVIKAVYFSEISDAEHANRIASRPNKETRPIVIEKFRALLVPPSLEEGFSEIIVIN